MNQRPVEDRACFERRGTRPTRSSGSDRRSFHLPSGRRRWVTSGYVAFHANTIMIGPVRRPPIDPTGVTFTSYRGRIERSNDRVRGKIWIQRGYFSESSSKWISLANHERLDRLIVPTISHIAWELPISDSQFQVLIGRSWV